MLVTVSSGAELAGIAVLCEAGLRFLVLWPGSVMPRASAAYTGSTANFAIACLNLSQHYTQVYI